MADDKLDTTQGIRRMSALEALRKQAETRAKVEDPAIVRAKAIDALNKEMREISQYLGQIGGEISSVKPEAGAPYEILFFGKIPVTLANAWVDSRPRRVDGQDCCERVYMRYQVNPASPAKVTLLGGDIAQTEQTMKMLGHKSPNMTLRYVEVSLLDVEHKFQLARQQPRHRIPAPKIPSATSPTPDLSGLLGSLHVTQHVLEIFRRTLPQGPDRRLLDRLANRLTKITSETKKLGQA